MIADGRETELIPFMLRPFRCTDTRGRQAGPRQCVYTYVCMHVVGPQRVDTNDIPSYLWEEPSYRTFCLCVRVWKRERGYTSTRDQGEAFGASLYLLSWFEKISLWNSHFSECMYFILFLHFLKYRKSFENHFHSSLSSWGTYHWI